MVNESSFNSSKVQTMVGDLHWRGSFALHLQLFKDLLYMYNYKISNLDVAFTLAPWSINNFTISAYPPDAASINGVESPNKRLSALINTILFCTTIKNIQQMMTWIKPQIHVIDTQCMYKYMYIIHCTHVHVC